MRAVLLACLSLCFCSSASNAGDARPNVVFILADDLGYGDLGCYGHPYAKTPHLDRLAAEGTRFTQSYATGVTCCPARTGLMTGKFPATFQKYPASFGYGDRVTVTELLHRAGYATGHFGKWHMGPDTKPGTYGIEVIGPNDEGQPGKRRMPERGRDAAIFDGALRFVEEHRGKPFYVNVWGHITHHPINPAPRFVQEFAALKVKESDFSDHQREKFDLVRKNGGDVDVSMRNFLADAYSLDQDVGRLLRKLDELGLRENTTVVFSSDQGAAAPRDPAAVSKKNRDRNKPADEERERLSLNLVGSAGPFRGGKHRDYEGGVRVPFILRWPGHAPAGRVDLESVLSGADWLPTLCAITGTPTSGAEFDGEDASRAFAGHAHRRTRPLFWKTNADNSDPSMRRGNWKFHGSNRRRGEVELYDLAADPAERTNLAAARPDIVADLSARLDAWKAGLPAHYKHGQGRDD